VFLLCGTALSASPSQQLLNPRVRCIDSEAKSLLASLVEESPTARQLVDQIENSDLIVFVKMTEEVPRYTANTRLLTAVTDARLVLVSINPFGTTLDLMTLLGHELRHVAEIAEARDVRTADDMRKMYRRIGWRASAPDGYETVAARETGRQVRQEILHGRPDYEALSTPR
jgi:hypothetical protein